MKTWLRGACAPLRSPASACVLLTAFCAGCGQTTTFDRDFVSSELQTRVGAALPLEAIGTDVQVAAGSVSMRTALAKRKLSPSRFGTTQAFHSRLSELGIARGDLVEAGLLPNPVLSLVFPGVGSTRSGR